MKKLSKHSKSIQDSILNKMHENIIVNIDIPDIEEIINSALENMDFDALREDIKSKVLDNEELKEELENLKEHRNYMDYENLKNLDKLKELENLDEKIQTEINEKLKNLDIKIEINEDGIEKLNNLPDSIKTKMKHMKIKINNRNENKENEEEQEEQEPDNE
jgi:hypothetical protein